ncbi:MAG: thioesterase family protein [Marinilabiliales bacterium]
MIQYDINIRVLYGDTDKMGVVYYGHYPRYYESGRTELMRYLGISYKSLEDKGIMMPVVEMHMEYLRSAYYDDNLTVRTIIKEMPKARIRFYYEIYNEDKVLINKAYTDLSFINSETYRPVRPPAFLIEKLQELL